MKHTLQVLALFATVFATEASFAKVIHACDTAESIEKRADDEICDYFVDASEDCFQKLNERLTLFEARPASTPAKDLLTEAEPIKESLDAGIATVKTYIGKMTDDNVCGDQKERVNVMIDEMNTDLKAVTKRINELKEKKK